ncbi:TetR/AcrR family transcriptional regulator [Sphingobium sufflavum]|uniref:TetR/AcrR family transcriptional regulator n=1 Tax=Sphingobium sufflavum TaxID=1129547 RepID=UPI002DD42215|nr:TetR/AcrR family transcriptional regulator [Sphingobium sufflavum]MCE7796745.1 TetR/AcrR family transcriptional regulator [Sphingobium sufflavum]
MSEKKRIRREPAETRTLILDATEALMQAEGYAAVSSRRVAKEAGLTAPLVHYYYPTTDDLFVDLHRRMTERQVADLGRILDCADPVTALWEYQAGWAQSALGVEFIALANHRKAIRPLIAERTEAARDVQASAIAKALERSGVDTTVLPPVALAMMLVGIARTLANEESVGITRGHSEVRACVDALLARLREGELTKGRDALFRG